MAVEKFGFHIELYGAVEQRERLKAAGHCLSERYQGMTIEILSKLETLGPDSAAVIKWAGLPYAELVLLDTAHLAKGGGS